MTDHTEKFNKKDVLSCHLGSFFEAIRFLTILPLPMARKSAGRSFSRALFYFGPVGSLIGVGLMLILKMMCSLPEPVSAALAVILLSFASGFLHLDGLADTADGFMSHRDRNGCLTIMRDSRIGVMGAAAMISLFLVKFSVITSLDKDVVTTAVVVTPVAGRTAITAVMALLPYAREEGGLGSLFYSRSTKRALLVNVLYLILFVCIVDKGIIFPVFLSAAITVIVVSVISKRKIGGATGDILGAVCELTEVAVLVSISVVY